MIANRAEPRRAVSAQENNQFLHMFPKIRAQARLAFRRLRPEHKDELVEEVIVNAYCAFVRLVCRGKISIAYATPLANFAIRQVLTGRRVGRKTSARDVMSTQARAAYGIVIERLDKSEDDGQWREALVEDRRSRPADVAAARIDIAAWLHSLSPRNRRIALILAAGARTSEVALQFDVSRARVSQLRRLFETSWESFQEGGQQRPSRIVGLQRCELRRRA